MHISDVVLQSLISNTFWLILLVLIVSFFHKQLRSLLNSLGSFKVAGASFELKDARSTIENYVILTNIMVEILANRDSALRLAGLLSPLSLRQLASFATKFSKDVPDDIVQLEISKNIAHIVGRSGDTDSAMLFFDALLKQRPKDQDILTLKAIALGEIGSQGSLREAERIQDDLIAMRPTVGVFWANAAVTKALLKKNDEAMTYLETAADLNYFSRQAHLLDLPSLYPLRREDRFIELQKRLEANPA